MRLSSIFTASFVALASAQAPGYTQNFTTVAANSTFNFGQRKHETV